MTWPTVNIVTTDMDAGTDSPATARTAIYDLAQKVNQMMSHVSPYMAAVFGSTTASAARSNLDTPSTSGTNATGTWNISVVGNAGTATSAQTGSFFIPRADSGSEGGQLDFARSVDNASYWHLDVFGSTTTPVFRFVAGSTQAATLDASGNLTATGNVTAFSDIRLKDSITRIGGALGKVRSLQGVTYRRKDLDGAEHTGLLAQEVRKVMPQAVQVNDDGYLSVAYGNLVGLLVEAIKELEQKVDRLSKPAELNPDNIV